jgi:hypothetical protein
MGCCGGGSDSSGSDTKFKALSARWEIAPDPIGEGGFGSVHLATNRKTGKVSTAAATPCSRLVLCLRPRLGLHTRLRVRLRLGCVPWLPLACALAWWRRRSSVEHRPSCLRALLFYQTSTHPGASAQGDAPEDG